MPHARWCAALWVTLALTGCLDDAPDPPDAAEVQKVREQAPAPAFWLGPEYRGRPIGEARTGVGPDPADGRVTRFSYGDAACASGSCSSSSA